MLINRALKCDVSFSRSFLALFLLYKHTTHEIKREEKKKKATVRKYFFNLIFHSFEFRLSCKIVAYGLAPLRSSILENNITLNKQCFSQIFFSLNRRQKKKTFVCWCFLLLLRLWFRTCVKKRINHKKSAICNWWYKWYILWLYFWRIIAL